MFNEIDMGPLELPFVSLLKTFVLQMNWDMQKIEPKMIVEEVCKAPTVPKAYVTKNLNLEEIPLLQKAYFTIRNDACGKSLKEFLINLFSLSSASATGLK